MKKLVLIRHAKSSWSDPETSDFERDLNKRGKRDAPFMAQKLGASGIKPDLIVASPAKRAKKTAAIIAEGVGYPLSAIIFHEEVYSASVDDLYRIIAKTIDDKGVLFLVGHNFAITDLAVSLTSQTIANIPTSGIMAIGCAISSWTEICKGCGQVDFFDYPKRYEELG